MRFMDLKSTIIVMKNPPEDFSSRYVLAGNSIFKFENKSIKMIHSKRRSK